MRLVLDDPAALSAAADGLRRQAGVYEDVGTLLRGLHTDDWTGSAADGFRSLFAAEPSRWFDASDTILTAAGVLDEHADVVRWAQGRLGEARDLHARAALVASPDAAVRMAEQADAIASDALDAFEDSSWLTSTRLDAAAEAAPRAPRWRSAPWWDVAWRATANAGVDAVNSLASIGTAIGHHPGDAFGLVAGVAMFDVGGTLAIASVPVDLTGVGAAVGVPAGAAGLALAGAGAVTGGASASDLWHHATTDDARTPIAKLPRAEPVDGSRGPQSTPEGWSDPRTLGRHFADHGSDFGASSAEEYATMAAEFFRRAQAEGLPTKIGADGTTRMYDAADNTFGSFTAAGKTKTFFKPSSPTYWARQPGGIA